MSNHQEFLSLVDSLIKKANDSGKILNLDQIAEKLQMQKTHFSDLCSGKQEVTPDELSRIKRIISSEPA